MFRTKPIKRKPDLLMLVTVFVCLGVVVTTTINAAGPAAASSGWGLQLKAEAGCDSSAWAEWRDCTSLAAPRHESFGLLEPYPSSRSAALSLSSERLPETGLVWYYSYPRQYEQNSYGLDLDLNVSPLAGHAREPRQFGMAVKRRYGSLGLSLGLEANRVDNLTDDPLIYFGTSYGW
ncbi:MAG: hypothetical protein PVH46_06275 [Granulosicoccaceae bacterium]|jgi:hypothetical protein